MKPITQPQLICLNVLIKKQHIQPHIKADMCMGVTGGRTTSTRELDIEEATCLIKHLKSLDPDEKSADKMRKKIIRMAHEMHWQAPQPPEGGNRKADMKRIDNWCRLYGYKHKSLDNYTYAELPTLVSQFEKMYNEFLSKL